MSSLDVVLRILEDMLEDVQEESGASRLPVEQRCYNSIKVIAHSEQVGGVIGS